MLFLGEAVRERRSGPAIRHDKNKQRSPGNRRGRTRTGASKYRRVPGARVIKIEFAKVGSQGGKARKQGSGTMGRKRYEPSGYIPSPLFMLPSRRAVPFSIYNRNLSSRRVESLERKREEAANEDGAGTRGIERIREDSPGKIPRSFGSVKSVSNLGGLPREVSQAGRIKENERGETPGSD